MEEDYRQYMKNDDEENPTTLSNESIRKIMDILEEEIKCSLLFLEEKGVSIEELDNFRKNAINYIHENADNINCNEEYKTRIIIMTYEKLLYTVFTCGRVCR